MIGSPERMRNLPPAKEKRSLASLISRFRSLRILIVGDVMLDEYMWASDRLDSQEASAPILRVHRQTDFLGGAGNVAANIADLGGVAWLVGVIGADAQGAKVLDMSMHHVGIQPRLSACQDRPTITKTRINNSERQMLRIDLEETRPISTRIETDVIQWVRHRISDFQACILSDYGKGMLTERLTRALIEICRQAKIPVIVDPKGCEFIKYYGATVVKPNWEEACLASKNTDETMLLEEVGAYLQSVTQCEALIITRDSQGIYLFTNGSTPHHIPVEAKYESEVIGAGDLVAAVMALSLAADADIETAAKLANHAAGIAAGKANRTAITINELLG